MTIKLKGLGMENITSPAGERTSATHKTGSKTIDHIWVAKSLVPLVKRFRYIPFNFGFDADHRGMFIDIKSKEVDDLQTSGRRRRKLKSKNPKSVKSYLKIVMKAIQCQNIEGRIAKVEGSKNLTEEEERELDKINQTLTEILLKAESKLQPHRSDDTWFEKLHEAKKLRQYWQKILYLRRTDTHFAIEKYNSKHETG